MESRIVWTMYAGTPLISGQECASGSSLDGAVWAGLRRWTRKEGVMRYCGGSCRWQVTGLTWRSILKGQMKRGMMEIMVWMVRYCSHRRLACSYWHHTARWRSTWTLFQVSWLQVIHSSTDGTSDGSSDHGKSALDWGDVCEECIREFWAHSANAMNLLQCCYLLQKICRVWFTEHPPDIRWTGSCSQKWCI